MSFSDDGWGSDTDDKASFPKQVEAPKAPVVQMSRVSLQANIRQVEAEPVKSFGRDTELKSKVDFGEPAFLKNVDANKNTNRMAQNAHHQVAADLNTSDDGWGSPLKSEVRRDPIAPHLKSVSSTTNAAAMSAVPDDDTILDLTLDVPTPRELSPVPPMERPQREVFPPMAQKFSSSRRVEEFTAPSKPAFGQSGNQQASKPSLKPTGFGGEFSKPSGFASQEPSKPSFGKQNSIGMESNTEQKQSESTGKFGNRAPEMERPASGFGGSFGGSSKPTGFGGSFGNAQSKPSGFGGNSVLKPSGFGGSESQKTGFGGQAAIPEKPSSGFGNHVASGFGGPNAIPKPAFGSQNSNSAGFGSSSYSKPSGFGVAKEPTKETDFGAKSTGFGGGFGRTAEPQQDSYKQSGFGSSSRTSGFGDNSNKVTSRQPSNFGGSEDKFGFDSSEKDGFEPKKPSGGFGTTNAGFGSSGGSGFSKPSSGFGGGFGGSSGFGNSAGFGKSGFEASTDKGFRSFGGKDNGFGNAGNAFTSEEAGGERKRGCFNCGQEGHRKDECPEPPKSTACRNCGQEGHYSRECTEPRVPNGACRNCGQEGHFSRECTEPRVPTGPCRNCGQSGHFAKECTNERVYVEPTEPCRRCNEEGHWGFECPTLPRDLHGNLLVPYDVVFRTEDELFSEAVDNDSRMMFDQKVFASMGNNSVPDYASFEEFKLLAPQLHSNLKQMKMNRPTPIQKAAFYPILHGNDVVACSHTGSGKTLAFLLPIITRLFEEKNDKVRDEKPSPSLLVVAPTRELASQTFNVARQLTYKTGLNCGIAFGGYSRSSNLQHLRGFEQLHVLVATMGRLQDFLESGDLSLDKLKFVVLDEADRMVDSTDFGLEVTKVIGTPEERSAQTVLFSASFSETLQSEDLPKFVKEGYTMLQVDKFGTANECIEQDIICVLKQDKKMTLFKLLGMDENTLTVNEDARILKEKTLIFVNSVKFSDSLASILTSSGIKTIPMHSHQNQESRDSVLEDFRRGKFMCMVASNVCARGLNISGLDHVINYDMPDKNGFDEYVNRIGRTGRAGFTGSATAFVDEESDREIIPLLVNVLIEAKKQIPEWLTKINDQAGEYNDEEGAGEQW